MSSREKKSSTLDFRDQNGFLFGDGEKFVIRLSVINFITSFQNVLDGFPIQPCGFFCRGKRMEKHLWLVLNFDRESHFIWGKKSSFLEKNGEMKLESKIFISFPKSFR